MDVYKVFLTKKSEHTLQPSEYRTIYISGCTTIDEAIDMVKDQLGISPLDGGLYTVNTVQRISNAQCMMRHVDGGGDDQSR